MARSIPRPKSPMPLPGRLRGITKTIQPGRIWRTSTTRIRVRVWMPGSTPCLPNVKPSALIIRDRKRRERKGYFNTGEIHKCPSAQIDPLVNPNIRVAFQYGMNSKGLAHAPASVTNLKAGMMKNPAAFVLFSEGRTLINETPFYGNTQKESDICKPQVYTTAFPPVTVPALTSPSRTDMPAGINTPTFVPMLLPRPLIRGTRTSSGLRMVLWCSRHRSQLPD